MKRIPVRVNGGLIGLLEVEDLQAKYMAHCFRKGLRFTLDGCIRMRDELTLESLELREVPVANLWNLGKFQ